MIEIKDKHNCCGCSACAQKCPKQCISMQEDEEGFLYPKVEQENCIECGLCEQVCSILHPLEIQPSLKEAFAVINNDEATRLKSSSGGFFSALAKQLFDEKSKGVFIFGAKYSEDFLNLMHSSTNNYDEIQSFCGSKYTQSRIMDCYRECKKLLDAGHSVLFSGTPCQIGGLKSFLGKMYSNLYLVDFICHGVPSPLLWRKYVEYREKQYGAKVMRTFFRRKNEGWKKFSMWFAFSNNNEYCQNLTQDPYMQMFLKNVCLRPSCYSCKFKSIDRHSDITMADFWGIQNEYPELDDDKGVSFVVVHSEKGKKLFELLTDCIKKSVPLESGLKHNPSMIKSCHMPEKRKTFFKDLNTLTFEKVIKKYAVTQWWTKSYRFVRRCARKALRMVGFKK